MDKASLNAIQYFGVVGIDTKLIPLKSEDSNSTLVPYVA